MANQSRCATQLSVYMQYLARTSFISGYGAVTVVSDTWTPTRSQTHIWRRSLAWDTTIALSLLTADLPPGPIDLPPGPADLPPSPADLPPGPTDLPPGPTDLPPGPTDLPPGPTDLPPGPADLPPGPTDLPPGPTDLPPGPNCHGPLFSARRPRRLNLLGETKSIS